MSAEGYRAVCPVCKTILVSAMPHGRFLTFQEAVRVNRAHLIHRCDGVKKELTDRELDIVSEAGVEVVQGAA